MTDHHGIDYVELAAPDLAAATAFYGAAFGWTFTEYGPPGEPAYVGIRRADGEMGGFDPTATPSPGGPLVLLWSADLDASAASVAAAGGELVEGPYAFLGGRRFTFRDPAGNVLGVWGA
jgi:uncharacterized protein